MTPIIRLADEVWGVGPRQARLNTWRPNSKGKYEVSQLMDEQGFCFQVFVFVLCFDMKAGHI
jgi:hypothetical protein